MSIVVALKTAETPLDSFFRQTLEDIKARGQTKVMIIAVNDDGTQYKHSLDTVNLKASECIAMCAVTTDVLIKSMG